MRYRGFVITACTDNGVERTDPNTGKDVTCDGYYCQVYRAGDEWFDHQIDDFCLAVGHEIPDDSDESLCKGIREYVDDMFYSLQKEKERLMTERKNTLVGRLAAWLVETQGSKMLYDALNSQIGMEAEDIRELGFSALTPYFDRTYYAQTIADHIVDHGSAETENGRWRVTFSDLNKRYGVDLPGDQELLQGIGGHLRMGYGMTVTDMKIGKRGISVDFHPICCPKVRITPVMGGSGPQTMVDKNASGLPVTPQRWRELAGYVLDYVNEYFQGSELYGILHHSLEMSHKEIEALGYELSQHYEAESMDTGGVEQSQTHAPKMTM